MKKSMGNEWTYGICESCLKNSHKKIKMVREKIFSGNPRATRSKEMWVCPVCGATKEL